MTGKYSKKRKCKNCQKELPSNRWAYCSHECRVEFLRKKYIDQNYKEVNPYRGKNTIVTGAISELRVAIDLMTKGYDVFRAISPSCPCDLAILKNGKLLRIEVRTATRSSTGKIYKTRSNNDHSENIDLFADVLPDTIFYTPQLP